MLISDVIDRSLACGLVTKDEVVWQGVTVDSVGRSHPVFRIVVGDEPRAFIKYFEPKRGETDGDPFRERAVIALATRPAIAAATAPAVPWDGDDNVVVTKALSGQSAWTADHAGGGALDPAQAWSRLVQAAVPKLAALHLATRDLASPDVATVPAIGEAANVLGGVEPWGLRVFSKDAPPELWADPVLGPLLHEADLNTTVRHGVQRARQSWRQLCLVHSDLKHDNVLTDADSGEAVFIDWEMARLGDPAWDLAALMTRLPILTPDSQCWGDFTLRGARELVDAYVAATPLTAPALAQRVVLYVGVWLIMTAVQSHSVDHSEAGADATKLLLAKAAHTFENAPQLTVALLKDHDA